METSKPISDIDPRDLAVVERLFGQAIDKTKDAVLVLKTISGPPAETCRGEVPSWCDVLEGISDTDLEDLQAAIEQPVRLGRSSCDGT